MPVLTRSKRKTTDCCEDPSSSKRTLIKLVDITNRKNSAEEKAAKSTKSRLTTQKSDSVLYTKKIKVEEPSMQCASNTQLSSQFSFSSASQSSQKTPDEALNAMIKIRNLLKSKFLSVENRLQLDVLPNCLYDYGNCEQNHSSNAHVEKATTEDVFLLKLFLSEERHFQFIQCIRRNLIASNIFPGTDICLSIIKEIMKCKSKDTNLKTSFILTELHDVFITMLNTFPPCLVQESYLRMFTSLVKIEGLPEKKQVLMNILDTIGEMIHEKDNGKLDQSFQIDFNKNFFMWDLEHTESSSFESLTRNDRFTRLFLVLDILVRVMEYDTAMYTAKNVHQFATNIASAMKPLLCSVIWQNGYGEMMSVNATVKKIISTFVLMTALKYPKDKIKIIARLLNLVVSVMNMYEYSVNGTVQYPISKNYTQNFVNEMKKTVESSAYYSMDLWLNVIENIKSPLVRMLLANQIYSKLVGKDKLPYSLSIPFDAIHSRSFLLYKDQTVQLEEPGDAEKYPRYDKSRISTKFRVSQTNFIRLMMLFADAVIKNFHLGEIVSEVKKLDLVPSDADVEMKNNRFDLDQFEKEVKNIDLNEKVTLRSIQPIPNVVHIRFTREDCTFYRNEIKKLPYIVKLIKRCSEKYGSVFHEWMENLQEV